MEEQELCPECDTAPVSPVDKNFLKLFPKCWECYEKDWNNKKITTEEFEWMENAALNETMN